MKTSVIISILFLILLVSCQDNPQEVTLTPFAGGTDGVIITFEDIPQFVFDKGAQSFDIFVKLENRGETEIAKEDIRVKLEGFERFDTQGVTQKNPDEDVIGVKKDPAGNIVPNVPVRVDFTANYLDAIKTVAPFSIKASACYKYKTTAVTQLCVRQDLQNPAPNGICVVDEAKSSSSSGAPVQIQNVVEQASGSSKIQFRFDVAHTGGGVVYKLGHDCTSIRAFQNKIILKVDTGIEGTSCTQLKTRTGTAVEGEVDLTSGTRQIYCTIPINKKSDYEFLTGIEAAYSYESSTSVQELLVKESN